MKNKIISSMIVLIFIIAIFMIIYPTVEYQTEDRFLAFRYSDDISEFETELSFNESYSYYAERDISIYSFDVKKFLCFYVISMEYVEGNYCETEFVLEEEYIDAFLERAEIQYNSDNVDVASLIEGKKAVVGNTRYVYQDDAWQIDYVLDDRYETMLIFYEENLLIIEVGLPDEGARYIAYK